MFGKKPVAKVLMCFLPFFSLLPVSGIFLSLLFYSSNFNLFSLRAVGHQVSRSHNKATSFVGTLVLCFK